MLHGQQNIKCFNTFLLWRNTYNNLFTSRETRVYGNVCRQNNRGAEGKLVAQGDYSSVANCPTKIPVILQGIFGIVLGILKYLCV
jgi:hypothetical protein